MGLKLTLTKREQQTVLLGGGLALVVLWVYVAYIVGPLQKRFVTVGQQVRAAREQVRLLEQVTANEAAIRQQHAQLDDTVTSLRHLLPSEEELPAVIEFLSDLASQSQVKIQTIFPQRPVEGQDAAAVGAVGQTAQEPAVYKQIPIQIDAQAGYHQLGVFLSLVESSGKALQVSNLRISGSAKEPKRHDIKMVLLGHFALVGP